MITSRLCDLFGYRRAVLFARARAGITATLRVLGANTLYGPSNACPAVVYAAVAARAAYVPMAVDLDTGLARSLIEPEAERHGAVAMPTHLYGSYLDNYLTPGCFILENDTLAVTALRRCPPSGDALLVSFAKDKTIDAGGGGAILTDDVALADQLIAYARTRPGWATIDQQLDEARMLQRRGGTLAEDQMAA